MADQIRVNGNQISWGSIIFKLDSERFTGFTAISYSDKRERVKAYGMGRHHAPRGRSRGKYTVEPVKITGWTASVQALREGLARRAADGVSYGDVEFQGLVQYIEATEQDITVELDRLVWLTNTTSNEEAPDPLKEEFELDCMLIRRNGLVLFDQTEGSP
jgi:hypothetical protein